MKYALFLFSVVYSLPLFATKIKECGVYSGQGYAFESKSKHLLFILDENTNSQINLDLGIYDKDMKDNFLAGAYSEILFEVESRCMINCNAKFKGLVQKLSPTAVPATFSTINNEPLQKKACK